MAPGAEMPLLTPSVAPAPAAAPPTPFGMADELACLALQCAVADKELERAKCFHPSELWSPLKFNDATGKLEARAPSGWLQGGGAPSAERLSNDANIDSPIEPGMTKRDVSFSTQMVRRAVSFVFTDAADDSASPLKDRAQAHSPHTALAA